MAQNTPYQFRQQVYDNSPSWLQQGLNQKLMFANGLTLDALGDALIEGIQSRFPGLQGYQALGLTGEERRIRRGLTEDDATYAERLRGYLDYHRTRGGPYAMLTQMSIRYANAFKIDLVYRNGRRYTLNLDGTITRDVVPSWNPDPFPEHWARWWMIVYSDAFTSADAQRDLAIIPREWGNAHCQGQIIVLGSGAYLIDYHSPDLIDQPSTINTPTAAIYIEV